MLRVAAAVAAGFLAISVLTIATQVALLRFFFHSEMDGMPLPGAYLLAYGAGYVIYAVIGGCITAAIAERYEAPTILGALLLGIGIGGLVMRHGSEPVWFAVAVPMAGAVAAVIAGYRWIGRPLESPPQGTRR